MESFQYTTLQGGMVSKRELEQAKLDLDQRTFRQEFEGTFENYAGANILQLSSNRLSCK